MEEGLNVWHPYIEVVNRGIPLDRLMSLTSLGHGTAPGRWAVPFLV